MAYRVEITRSAEKDLGKLDSQIAKRIAAAIRALAEDPHPPGVDKLAGRKFGWRIRVGGWRVLYDVYDDLLVIDIIRVQPRGQVYKNKR